jgi:predicted ABC-type ATPase
MTTVMASRVQPAVVVLAGPNGSGKSTAAPFLLRDALAVTEFVNADTIAQGLSAFNPLGQALEAGRILHARLRELAAAHADFAFETTLATRSLAPWLAGLRRGGYRVHLVFLWLPSAEAAVARVAQRIRAGGHQVPEETIRRRYAAGLRNFFSLYQSLADTWIVYDNSRQHAEIIAEGKGTDAILIANDAQWQRVRRGAAT